MSQSSSGGCCIVVGDLDGGQPSVSMHVTDDTQLQYCLESSYIVSPEQRKVPPICFEFIHCTYSTQFVFGTTLKIEPVVCVHGSHVACELICGMLMRSASNSVMIRYEEVDMIIITTLLSTLFAMKFALAIFEHKMRIQICNIRSSYAGSLPPSY